MYKRKQSSTKNNITIETSSIGLNLYSLSKKIIEEQSPILDNSIAQINIYNKYLTSETNSEIKSITEQIVSILNLYSISVHIFIDLSINVREFYLAKKRIEQILYIKHIYIELYRYLERHNSDLGLLKTASHQLNIYDKYKQYVKIFNEFKQKEYSQIKEHRNKIFAHINDTKDYKDYYSTVISIDIEDVGNMLINFINTYFHFFTLVREIVQLLKEKMEAIHINVKKKLEKLIIEIYPDVDNSTQEILSSLLYQIKN